MDILITVLFSVILVIGLALLKPILDKVLNAIVIPVVFVMALIGSYYYGGVPLATGVLAISCFLLVLLKSYKAIKAFLNWLIDWFALHKEQIVKTVKYIILILALLSVAYFIISIKWK